MENIEKIKLQVKDIQNLFLSRRYNLIIQETRKAIKKYPKISIFYNMMGLALTQQGKLDDAKFILSEGLKINPNDLAIINNLANVYKNIFNYSEAEKLYKLSILKKKDYFNAYVNYGNLNRDLNKFEEAIKLYEKALNYNNKIPEIFYSLAMAHQSLGNFEQAENFALKTLSLDKKNTKSDLLISRSKKYTPNDNHFRDMQQKLQDSNLNNLKKIDLYFALAKAFEDFGEINKSFEYLKKGNELKRSVINFDLKFEIKKFEIIKNFFQKIDIKDYKNKSFNNKKIIFIVGMPRSGTTLTEQIISSHTKVYGCGELPYLTKIINDEFLDGQNLSSLKIDETFNDTIKISEISNKYYSYIKNYNIIETHITDKAPLNFFWIGFIKVFFPHSKIIHCKRDPEDNCVSLYKNIFDGNLSFCYSQNELAKYYNLYSDLLKFWKKNFPDCILDIEYEKLVTNTKNETKKMLDFCELDWEENCLDFSNNKTPIKTASVGQARSKIYSTSLKSSTKYSVFLKELFDLLKKKAPD